MKRRTLHGALAVAAATLFFAACAARTGLDAPEEIDAAVDVKHDVKPDVHDASVIDVVEEDSVPPIDVVFPDVPIVSDCPDAGSTFIYLLGSQNQLYSFYPPTLTATLIGKVGCTAQASPFSMAVDRQGTAYSVFTNGDLFEISTANASCKGTSYQANQLGWTTFGMGYANIPDSGIDGGDQLFVIEVDFNQPSLGLGTIDTSTFTLTKVGSFSPDLTPECELTGTGDGRLFALCLSQQSGSTLAEIDPTSAQILGEDQLQIGGGQEALAFAFWGGQFWIFTSPGNSTTVTRYDPGTKVETQMTTLGAQIVGAGVSTCAPQ